MNQKGWPNPILFIFFIFSLPRYLCIGLFFACVCDNEFCETVQKGQDLKSKDLLLLRLCQYCETHFTKKFCEECKDTRLYDSSKSTCFLRVWVQERRLQQLHTAPLKNPSQIWNTPCGSVSFSFRILITQLF